MKIKQLFFVTLSLTCIVHLHSMDIERKAKRVKLKELTELSEVEQNEKLVEKLMIFSGEESINDIKQLVKAFSHSVLDKQQQTKEIIVNGVIYKTIQNSLSLGVQAYDIHDRILPVQSSHEKLYHSDDTLLLTKDKKLLLAAKICSGTNGHTTSGYAIFKYNPGGIFDESFNNNGKCIEERFGTIIDRLLRIIIQPNGNILLWQKRSDGYCIDIVSAQGEVKTANVIFNKK